MGEWNIHDTCIPVVNNVPTENTQRIRSWPDSNVKVIRSIKNWRSFKVSLVLPVLPVVKTLWLYIKQKFYIYLCTFNDWHACCKSDVYISFFLNIKIMLLFFVYLLSFVLILKGLLHCFSIGIEITGNIWNCLI